MPRHQRNVSNQDLEKLHYNLSYPPYNRKIKCISRELLCFLVHSWSSLLYRFCLRYSDLAIKSIGNAVSAPGWTVTASNLVTNGIGLVYGTITHNTDAAPIWGELVGTFPNFSARYNIPVLLFVTSGTVYVTANISQAGELKLYGPDFEKLNIKGKAYQFNAVYYAGN